MICDRGKTKMTARVGAISNRADKKVYVFNDSVFNFIIMLLVFRFQRFTVHFES